MAGPTGADAGGPGARTGAGTGVDAGTGSAPTEGRRVAVVGLGDISGVHLTALAELSCASLVGVCDVDPDRASAGGRHWGVPGFTDMAALLATARPDVVHLCLPHAAHAPAAAAALDAGVHVLTEKPLAESVAAGEALAAHARRAYASRGTRLGVCLQNRYNPTSRALRSALESGEFGTVLGARAAVWWHRSPAYYEAAPWRGTWVGSGGGVLINQAIHTLDLLTWLLGEPETVAGHAATTALTGHIEVEDTAHVHLTHPGGVRSVLFATNAHVANAPVQLEVSTDRGLLRLDDGVLQWLPSADASAAVEATDAPTRDVRVLAEETEVGGARSYWGASHAALIADFHARLGDDRPFWIGADDALVALRVLRRIYAASGLVDVP